MLDEGERLAIKQLSREENREKKSLPASPLNFTFARGQHIPPATQVIVVFVLFAHNHFKVERKSLLTAFMTMKLLDIFSFSTTVNERIRNTQVVRRNVTKRNMPRNEHVSQFFFLAQSLRKVETFRHIFLFHCCE